MLGGAIMLTLAAASCGESTPTPNPQKMPALQQAIAAVGGAAVLDIPLSIQVTGAFFEEHQDGPEIRHLESRPAEYRAQIEQADGEHLQMVWEQDFIYPFVYAGTSTIVISKQQGSIEGVHGFGSRYFGFSDPSPLSSSRLEAIKKTRLMANPLVILKKLRDTGGEGLELLLGQKLPSIQLKLDPGTHLPSSAQVLESDALLGDVIFEVRYSSWDSSQTPAFPAALEYSLDGQTIRREQVVSVGMSSLVESNYRPSASSEYDQKQGALGLLSSQWYQRMFSFGFSQDMAVEEVNIEQIGPKTHLITGPAGLAYASVVVESEEGLIVLEPNLNHHRSQAVIETLSKQFSGQKLAAVVATHTHMDHFGGVRTFLAQGAKLYLGEAGLHFAKGLQSRKSQLVDDGLGVGAVTEVEGISKRTAIGAGEGRFELIPLSTDHVDDMLAIYFPSSKILFLADLFNAGFVYGLDYYTVETRQLIIKRAKLVKAFIEREQLDVERLVGVHGGVAPVQEVLDLANAL